MKLNKIIIVYDSYKIPYFYNENMEKFLIKYNIDNYDVIETPLDINTYEQLWYEQFLTNLIDYEFNKKC